MFYSVDRCPICRHQSNRRNILKLFFGHEHQTTSKLAAPKRNLSQSMMNLEVAGREPGVISSRRSTISEVSNPKSSENTRKPLNKRQTLIPMGDLNNQRSVRTKKCTDRTIFQKKQCLVCEKKFIKVRAHCMANCQIFAAICLPYPSEPLPYTMPYD